MMPIRDRKVTLGLLLAGLSACAPSRGTMGAVLAQSSQGDLTVHEVPQGLAAQRAGLKPGDRILLIDGRDARAFDEASLHAVLGGEVGAVVHLTVLRGQRVERIALKRTPAPKGVRAAR